MVDVAIAVVEGDERARPRTGPPQELVRGDDVVVTTDPVEMPFEHRGRNLHRRKREAVGRVEAFDDAMVIDDERQIVLSVAKHRAGAAPGDDPRGRGFDRRSHHVAVTTKNLSFSMEMLRKTFFCSARAMPLRA